MKRFFDIGSIPGVSERDFGSEGIVCRPDVSDIGVYSGFGRIEYTDVFFEKIAPPYPVPLSNLIITGFMRQNTDPQLGLSADKYL